MGKREINFLQHQFVLLRYFLKTIKIDKDVPFILKDITETIIEKRLSHNSPKIRSIAFEVYGLIMIHNKEFFEDKIETFMNVL